MRRIVLFAAVLAATFLGRAGVATAAVTCTSAGTYPNRTMVIHLTADNDYAAIKKAPSSELLVNGGSCSPAKVFASERPTTYAVGAAGSQSLTLDLTGGPMHDDRHDADLHFLVDLAGGTNDNLVVIGSAAPDFLVGGAGGLNLDAGTDSDVDVLVANVETFLVYAGGGGDIVSGHGSYGTGAPLPYRTVLRGEDGPDILVGSPHDDSIRGGLGNDRLYGLAGFDSAEYLTAPSGVAVDLAGGSATGGDGTDQLSGFEDAFGSSHNDVLRGSAGADALSGNSGNDYLQGRGGNDQLFGGPGFDAALYTGASGPVTVSLLAGSSSGADGSDTLNTIEAVFGSPFNDVLVGDNNPNTLSGQDGNDHLWGLGANDVLLGNAGNDDMNGGTGTDTCSQGTGSGTSSACELP